MVTTPSSTSTLSQSISSTTKDLVELNTNTQLPIKLNSSNYPAWHRQIHSLLVARNLDGYITGETPCPSPKIKNTNDGSETDNPEFDFWIRQDKYLYIALLGSCDEEARAVMSASPTSRDAWLILERVFATRSRSRVMSLKERLNSIRKGSTTVAAYMQTIRSISDELSLIGHPVDDIDLVIHALNGLDPSFREFTASIRTRDTPISFDALYVKLIDEDLHLWNMDFEVDSKTVVDNIYGKQTGVSDFSAIITHCVHLLCTDLMNSHVKFIRRQGNEVAHRLAKAALLEASFRVYYITFQHVFQRERQNGHYGVIAYVIGNTFSSIPLIFLVTMIPAAITYYLSGLHNGCEHFLYFAAVLFSSLMLVESLMMIVASVVPNYLMGIITGAGIQAIMILIGGFFKLPHDLPKPIWRYPLHYVAFHTYSFEGLFKNEYEGLIFYVKNGQGTSNYITGEEILRDIWQSDMSYSKWVDLGILLGMIVLYRVLFLVITKITEKVKPIVGSLLSCKSISSDTIVEKPELLL